MKQLVIILIVLFTVSSCSSVQFAKRKHRKGIYFSLKKNHHHESPQNRSLKPIHVTKHPAVSVKGKSRASDNIVSPSSLITAPLNHKNATLIKELAFEQENEIESVNTNQVTSKKSDKRNKKRSASSLGDIVKMIIKVWAVLSIIIFVVFIYAVSTSI